MPWALSAQDCYRDYIQQGISSYENLQFEEAINLFEAAGICPDKPEGGDDEVQEWLTKSRNGYIDAITTARDNALKSEEAARELQREAEKQARISEANRLAYLATQELANDNADEALILAYLGLSQAGEESLPLVREAFGNSVAGALSTEFLGHGDAVTGVGFLNDGSALWSISDDRSLKVWSVEDASLIQTFQFDSPITCHAISKSGDLVAVADQLGELVVSDDGGNEIKRINTSESGLVSLVFSMNGSSLYGASRNGEIFRWQINGTDEISVNLDARPLEIVGSPNDDYFLVRMADNAVHVLDRNLVKSSSIRLESYVYDVQFSSRGDEIMVSAADGNIGRWSMQGEDPRQLNHGSPIHLVVTFDNGDAISGSKDGIVKFWNNSGNLLMTRSLNSRITDIMKSENNSHVVISTESGEVGIFGRDGTEVTSFSAHNQNISAVSISPESGLFATSSENGIVRLWNLRGDVLLTSPVFTEKVRSLTFTPDGHSIAAGSSDHRIVLTKEPSVVYEEMSSNPPVVTEAMKSKYGLN